MSILDHRGKRQSYEWAEKRRENKKRELLWDWIQYIELEGCKYGHVPKTWKQIEWDLERGVDGVMRKVMRNE